MAIGLPYFKFEPGTWDSGNIQMCSRESKGLFIDLCSLYWNRLGELPYALALQKLCNGNKDALQELSRYDIIGVVNGQIVVEFLDEQLAEFNLISEKRRESAQKRWSNANALQVESKSNANRIEESRIEENKVDEKRVDSGATKVATPSVDERKKIFMDRVAEFMDRHDKTLLRDFYDYWTEINEGGRRMRFEMQRVFDLNRRLTTWKKNESKYGTGNNKNGTGGITAEGTLKRVNSYRDKSG